MTGKLASSLELMEASWEILKKDKEILFIPVISGISVMVMLASFVIPVILTGNADLIQRLLKEDRDLAITISFIFYFLNYLIVVFFNSAIVACATIRMGGGDPTLLDGLNIASSRIFKIIMWAFVAASFGMLLRLIQGRSNLLGKAISGLLGMAWSLTSYLVIPVLVNENKWPFDAFVDSIDLLKKAWGEGLVGSFSFGLIFAIASLPAYFILGIGVYSGGSILFLTLIAAIAYFLVLSIFHSALQGIFQAALYQFASFGNVPSGFREDQLRHAIQKI
ncbi:MAG: DUF6159 family protein [Thermodesulfobacteriota bacterium]